MVFFGQYIFWIEFFVFYCIVGLEGIGLMGIGWIDELKEKVVDWVIDKLMDYVFNLKFLIIGC